MILAEQAYILAVKSDLTQQMFRAMMLFRI